MGEPRFLPSFLPTHIFSSVLIYLSGFFPPSSIAHPKFAKESFNVVLYKKQAPKMTPKWALYSAPTPTCHLISLSPPSTLLLHGCRVSVPLSAHERQERQEAKWGK